MEGLKDYIIGLGCVHENGGPLMEGLQTKRGHAWSGLQCAGETLLTLHQDTRDVVKLALRSHEVLLSNSRKARRWEPIGTHEQFDHVSLGDHEAGADDLDRLMGDLEKSIQMEKALKAQQEQSLTMRYCTCTCTCARTRTRIRSDTRARARTCTCTRTCTCNHRMHGHDYGGARRGQDLEVQGAGPQRHRQHGGPSLEPAAGRTT